MGETAMKFREHRGGLAESMATLVDLPDRAALVEHCRKLLHPFRFQFDAATLEVRPYCIGRGDDRIGWKEVHVVTIKGYGVIGFTDGEAR
jgi:hypothetical protein